MTQPWENTELPEPHDPMYTCPGPGWHSEGLYYDHDLRWMQGEPDSHHPQDDFYCDACIHDAEREAGKGGRPKVVLGPTLGEVVLRKRGAGNP